MGSCIVVLSARILDFSSRNIAKGDTACIHSRKQAARDKVAGDMEQKSEESEWNEEDIWWLKVERSRSDNKIDETRLSPKYDDYFLKRIGIGRRCYGQVASIDEKGLNYSPKNRIRTAILADIEVGSSKHKIIPIPSAELYCFAFLDGQFLYHIIRLQRVP